MAAERGRRSPTGRSRSGRWDRLRSRTRIRTSSTLAPDPTAFEATCRPAVVCIERPTVARPGSSLGLYNAGQIGAVRIHPTNPNIAWVAAYGDAFKRNAERGVFKTDDGGKTWRKVLYLNDGVGAMDVEVQPGNPNVVYAWMSRLERKPWTIISGSRDGGFFKSTDGGKHLHARSRTGLADRTDRQGESRRHQCQARSDLRARRGASRWRALSIG